MNSLFKKAVTYNGRDLTVLDLAYFVVAILSIIFTWKLVLLVATVITVGLYLVYQKTNTFSKEENEKITTTMIAYVLLLVLVYVLF